MSLLSVSRDLPALHTSLNGLEQRVARWQASFMGQRSPGHHAGHPLYHRTYGHAGFVYPPSLGPGGGLRVLI